MTDSPSLEYRELTERMVSGKEVEDINALLPQLSDKASLLTQDALRAVLNSGTRLFIAVDISNENKITGTVLLCPMLILVGRKDWIEDVVVDKNYRRLGIASALMDMAEAASRVRGASSVNLTSNPERPEARKMYEDRGYALRDTGVFRLTLP